MGKLGDHFPPEQKQGYIDRHLVAGQVLYLFCHFTEPPKEKYLVLVCAGTEALLFVVNSSVPPFVRRRPELLRCQVHLSASDHPFLDHNSVINCAEVIRASNQLDIVAQIAADIGRIKGSLNETTKKQVVDAVRKARTISPADRRAIEDALGRDE